MTYFTSRCSVSMCMTPRTFFSTRKSNMPLWTGRKFDREDFRRSRQAIKEQDDSSCESPVAGTIYRGGDVGTWRWSPSQLSRIIWEYWIVKFKYCTICKVSVSDFEDEIKLRGEGFVTPQRPCTVKSCISMHNSMKWKPSHTFGIIIRLIVHIFNSKTWFLA